jgi:hypothetical protein
VVGFGDLNPSVYGGVPWCLAVEKLERAEPEGVQNLRRELVRAAQQRF